MTITRSREFVLDVPVEVAAFKVRHLVERPRWRGITDFEDQFALQYNSPLVQTIELRVGLVASGTGTAVTLNSVSPPMVQLDVFRSYPRFLRRTERVLREELSDPVEAFAEGPPPVHATRKETFLIAGLLSVLVTVFQAVLHSATPFVRVGVTLVVCTVIGMVLSFGIVRRRLRRLTAQLPK